jgi:phytoene dehydrogenase-like protein
VSSSFYDVVVLGADLAPLTASALLAKRGFRVLVLCQSCPSPTYRLGAFTLPRRAFHYVLGQTPVSRRVFLELGLHQTVRRFTQPVDPAFQVALPGHRFDVTNDDARLAAEIEREFPEVKRPIDDFHKRVARVGEQLDTLLDRDLVFPPDTFLERQRVLRARRAIDLPRDWEEQDVLGEFPDAHPFRAVANLPARFEGEIDPEQHAPLRLMRVYGNCRRGALRLEGGLPALRELLIQKVRAHSGLVHEDDRADEVLVHRNQVTGVRTFGGGEEIACSFVVAGVDVAQLLRLLPDRHVFERLFERVGEPLLRHYRYTLNVVVRARGLPAGMARDVYVVRAKQPSSVASEVYVRSEPLDAAHTLISVEALLPSRRVEDEEGFVGGVRADLLRALRELVPFLDDHLVLVDSPHDGLAPVGPDTTLDPATALRRGPGTMPAMYSYPVLSSFGLSGLPIRSPIARLLLCNSQVMPGLGSEGALITASSTARVVSWADRGKAWMRRRLWTKVEF